MSALRSLALTACLLLAVASVSFAQRHRGGRYDDQIRAAVTKLLAERSNYKNVKSEVSDSVVTLTGSVELPSTRRHLVASIRRIQHVSRVDNDVVLDPPAESDQAVIGRLQQRLEDAGLKGITCRVREGAVTLEGIVRNNRDRERTVRLVKETPGVKEVSSKLTVAEK
jgi:osmotically-inducible protein OsmY